MASAAPRATVVEAITGTLTPAQSVMMTHLVVWLLVLVAGSFLALRVFVMWYRKMMLAAEDWLLAGAWVSWASHALALAVYG